MSKLIFKGPGVLKLGKDKYLTAGTEITNQINKERIDQLFKSGAIVEEKKTEAKKLSVNK